LAHIALGQDDRERAAALAEQARAMLPTEGCSAHHARLFGTLGAIALAEGDHRRAIHYWRDSLQQWRSLRNRRGVADGLVGLATVLQVRGAPEAATRLVGAAEALLEEVGARHLIHAVALDQVMETTRTSPDERTLAAREQGRTLPSEEVVREALALADGVPSSMIYTAT
jgi:ATP/maltotriose-dependent transcriptional regulator MalT